MRKSVSVPEKTLEHWSSQYITYRYPSQAALWWPASGEDINVGCLPARPGKIVQLELKTTTIISPMLHDVKIDLAQLRKYLRLPLGHQPFYVFPRPDWGGTLKAEAIAKGRAVTELAFTRSGPGWWFADWMVVLTAGQVAAVLRQELAAHRSKKRGITKRLVQFTVDPGQHKTTCTWGPSKKASGPEPVGWLDFWSELRQCGRAGWPQLIRLPAWAITNVRGPYMPRQVAAMLREAAARPAAEWDSNEQLMTLEPDADGNYQITEDPDGNLDRPGAESADEDSADEVYDDHRQIVFLDAWALRGAR